MDSHSLRSLARAHLQAASSLRLQAPCNDGDIRLDDRHGSRNGWPSAALRRHTQRWPDRDAERNGVLMEYLVTWRIFVEADTPEEAAHAALEAQRNVESHATCFDVRDELGRRSTVVCRAREGEMPVRRHLTLVKTSHA